MVPKFPQPQSPDLHAPTIQVTATMFHTMTGHYRPITVADDLIPTQ